MEMKFLKEIAGLKNIGTVRFWLNKYNWTETNIFIKSKCVS